jgi:hypothetical protein
VQLLVLMSLAAIGAIVTASITVARINHQAAAGLERTIEVEALATSALRRIFHAIENPTDDLELELLTNEVPLQVGGVVVGMKIESEASKVNLMLADVAMLQQYLTSAGLTNDEASAVAVAVEQARRNGERRRVFDTVLLALAGLLSQAELLEDVGVFGTTSGLDPAYATPRALASVPDLSPARVALLETTPPPDRARIGRSAYFANGGTRYSLVATIRWGDSQTSQRRLVVELTGAGKALPLSPGY